MAGSDINGVFAAIVDGVDTEDVLSVLGDNKVNLLACNAGLKTLINKVFDESQVVFVHHWAQFNDTTLRLFKKLRLIVRYGVGLDNIDIPAATKLGIAVCHTPIFGVEEVADSAMSHVLNLFRRTHQAAVVVTSGAQLNEIAEIRGAAMGARRVRDKTLGIMGLGRIGTATALRAKAFGFRVVFFDPLIDRGYGKALGIQECLSPEELMQQTDCLVLTMPLNESNKHCVNENSIKLMPKDAVVVNVSRGGLIDDVALANALKSGRLAGAAFDAHGNEPHNPMAEGGIFAGVPNVSITPHCAWYSAEAQRELFTTAATEARLFLEGKRMQFCVNRTDLGLA